MKQFEIGDQVTVYFSNGDHLPGKLINIPRGEGDSWHIEDAEGNLHSLNPLCSTFEQIVKFKNPNHG